MFSSSGTGRSGVWHTDLTLITTVTTCIHAEVILEIKRKVLIPLALA